MKQEKINENKVSLVKCNLEVSLATNNFDNLSLELYSDSLPKLKKNVEIVEKIVKTFSDGRTIGPLTDLFR